MHPCALVVRLYYIIHIGVVKGFHEDNRNIFNWGFIVDNFGDLTRGYNYDIIQGGSFQKNYAVFPQVFNDVIHNKNLFDYLKFGVDNADYDGIIPT